MITVRTSSTARESFFLNILFELSSCRNQLELGQSQILTQRCAEAFANNAEENLLLHSAEGGDPNGLDSFDARKFTANFGGCIAHPGVFGGVLDAISGQPMTSLRGK